MAAEPLAACGVLVALVEGAVVAVVTGVVAGAEAAEAVVVELCPDTVVAAPVLLDGLVVVTPDAAEVVATDEEWAELPEATSTPRPTAAADAATPIPTVARRTLLMARSRDRPEASGDGRRIGGGAMVDLSDGSAVPFSRAGGRLFDGTITTALVKRRLCPSCVVPVNVRRRLSRTKARRGPVPQRFTAGTQPGHTYGLRAGGMLAVHNAGRCPGGVH